LSALLPLFSAAKEYTTYQNVICFELPSGLVGPAEVTTHHASATAENKTIFVTAYARKSLFGATLVGNLNISLLEWPQGVTDFPTLLEKVEAQLTQSNPKVSRSRIDFHDGNWTVFKQRDDTGTTRAFSCYTLLPGVEVLYVGLVMDDRMSSRQRSVLTKALQDMLPSFQVGAKPKTGMIRSDR
jgi:hypothetical protein